jgi:hypothetical protein
MEASAQSFARENAMHAGQPLNGSQRYKLSFPKAPPHDPRAFWSLQAGAYPTSQPCLSQQTPCMTAFAQKPRYMHT